MPPTDLIGAGRASIQGFAGVDSFDDRSRVLAYSSVLGAILCLQERVMERSFF